MTNHVEQDSRDPDEGTDHDDHLADVEPGAGCTEIWEHLSERRNGSGDDEE